MQILRAKAEPDLPMPRHGARTLAIESPVAVSPAFAKKAGTFVSQMSLEVAAFHAGTTSSSDSLPKRLPVSS